jgi:hypothetical protein
MKNGHLPRQARDKNGKLNTATVFAGFAFFLVVIFSSYTAGILNALLQTEALVQLNFEDLQRDGDKVCVVSAAAVAFRLRYPEMVPQVIEVPNAAAGLDSIGTKCRAVRTLPACWLTAILLVDTL